MKKIAIVCGSPGSMMMAPFDDKDWEIWVLGNRINAFKDKRVTKIFEIHDDLNQHGVNNGAGYVSYLVNMKIDLIVGKNFPLGHPRAPHVKVFPFDAAKHLYGADYLTSSSAYMVAMAVLEGADEIAIYGVDMAVDDFEYFWQRPCMEAWVGFAKGRGIKITIPDISPLGKSDYIEGQESGGKPNFAKPPFTATGFMEVAEQHAAIIEQKQKTIDKITGEIMSHHGAKQVYERLAKVARAIEAGQIIDSLTTTIRIKGE